MRLLNEDQTADLEVSPETLQLEARAVTDMRGVGIASIELTSTDGLVDTYTITYTDGRTQTYTVTNGAEGPQGPRGDKGPRGYTGFSAYQYAVAGGYEGTEEEFTQLMASNATMADTVENYSWTEEIKTALMACFENVAWVNADGQTYYDALYAALYDRTWSITNTLTGCRNTNTMSAITKGRPYNGILEALSAYTMEGATVSVTMGGVDVTESVYSDGVISIPAVTGAVVITAEAVRTAWAVTNVLTNVTSDNPAEWVAFGEPYEATLTVSEGYEMDSVTITMGGEDVSNYYSSGTISIPAVTGDVVITATAVDPDAVPAGYTRVDYLTKGANTYDAVETGLYQSPTFAVLDCDFEFAMTGDPSTNEQGFGARLSSGATTATSEYAIFFGRSGVGAFRSTIMGNDSLVDVGTYSQNTWRKVKYRYNNGAPYFILDDGAPVSLPNPPATITANTTVPLRLCGINNNNAAPTSAAKSTGYGRWGKVTYYDANGNRLYHFVPAYNGSRYGYYENVHGVWYPSIRGVITGGNF